MENKKEDVMVNGIDVERDFLVINGKPVFLYGGDLSYCRVPRRSWKARMLQMKSAGMNTITVYTVWCYHQPKENVMDFSGERDLDYFLRLIQECGMYCVFRMGPFVHGEYRNGGLPQWLVEKLGTRVRTNDPDYLHYASVWYEALIRIVRPYLVSNGGPVILLQLENELGSAGCKGDDLARGSSSADENKKHLLFYYDLVRKAGIALPLLDINNIENKEELLKPLVDGGGMYPASCFYCDGDVPPFSDEWWKQHIRPKITIETGGGMFIRFFDTPPYRNTNSCRGPIIHPGLVESLVCKYIAEGCAGVNLYIVCDGQNPEGCGESGLPERNMNYQAPISVVGRCRDSYWKLKRIGWFLRSFQQEILHSAPDADWATVRVCGLSYPGAKDAGDLFEGYGKRHEENGQMAENILPAMGRVTTGLNLSESNFLVIRNFSNNGSQWKRGVRILASPSHLGSEVWQEYPRKTQLDLPPNTTKIMPFFVRVCPRYFIDYSTAELLDRREINGKTQVVLCESDEVMTETRLTHPQDAEFVTCGNVLALKESPNMTTLIARPERRPIVVENERVRVVLVTKDYAEHLWDVGETFAWSNAEISGSLKGMVCTAERQDFAMELMTCKPLKLVEGLENPIETFDERRGIYRLAGTFNMTMPVLEWKRNMEGENLVLTAEFKPEMLADVEEVIVTAEHDGTFAQAYLNDVLVSDHAYGKFLPWEISLRDLPQVPGTLKLICRDALECSVNHSARSRQCLFFQE